MFSLLKLLFFYWECNITCQKTDEVGVWLLGSRGGCLVGFRVSRVQSRWDSQAQSCISHQSSSMHFYVQWLVFIISFFFSFFFLAQHLFQVFKKRGKVQNWRKGFLVHLIHKPLNQINRLFFLFEHKGIASDWRFLWGGKIITTSYQAFSLKTTLQILKRDYVTFDRRNNTSFILQMKCWIDKQ